MLERLLTPFMGYWYWAQSRATPLSKGLAFAAPLVGLGLVAYLLFGGSGNGSSLLVDATRTGGNIAVGTEPPASTAVTTGGQPNADPPATSEAEDADPEATPPPQPTAFTQIHYTVEPGDNPGAIAEKVGVPDEIREAWIEEMLALNGVTATTLQVGQELILPPF